MDVADLRGVQRGSRRGRRESRGQQAAFGVPFQSVTTRIKSSEALDGSESCFRDRQTLHSLAGGGCWRDYASG